MRKERETISLPNAEGLGWRDRMEDWRHERTSEEAGAGKREGGEEREKTTKR